MLKWLILQSVDDEAMRREDIYWRATFRKARTRGKGRVRTQNIYKNSPRPHWKRSFSLLYTTTIMARKKNDQQKKDGKHRKETKEEKKDRLQSQQDARDVSNLVWKRSHESVFLKSFWLFRMIYTLITLNSVFPKHYIHHAHKLPCHRHLFPLLRLLLLL